MKKNSIIAICAIALAAIVIGCGKVALDYGNIQKLDDSQALLRINYVSQYANNRSVFFKVNDQRISSAVTARTPYPGGGYNTGGGNTADFLQFPAGTINFSVVMPHKIDNGTDSLVLYTTTFQLAGGKAYSAHITDTLANTKSLLTEETLMLTDSSYSRFHFVNLMPNVPAMDLYYGSAAVTATDQSTDSLIVGNVAYLQNTPDFRIKINGANKIWKIRAAGAAKNNTTVIASYTSTSVPASTRVFTAFASGYNGKTNTQKPYISFFLVR
jgi:hypothetical protein